MNCVAAALGAAVYFIFNPAANAGQHQVPAPVHSSRTAQLKFVARPCTKRTRADDVIVCRDGLPIIEDIKLSTKMPIWKLLQVLVHPTL